MLLPVLLLIFAQDLLHRGPTRIQQDLLKLIAMSNHASSLSHACKRCSSWLTEGDSIKMSSNDIGTASGQDGSDCSHDLPTLTFDLGGHGAWGWCRSSSFIRIPSLKFAGLAIRKIWRTMCVNINGPHDLDLWHWNWYVSRIKGGKPYFEMWARRPLGSLIIRYVYAADWQTDGQTKARLISPLGRGHNKALTT